MNRVQIKTEQLTASPNFFPGDVYTIFFRAQGNNLLRINFMLLQPIVYEKQIVYCSSPAK